jgi:uncharacterized protein (TIGR00369 family)
MPLLTADEIYGLMDQYFPDARTFSRIEAIGEHEITMRMPWRKELMRGGGTISGPAMMTLADTSSYFVILAHAGASALSAATANLDIAFLKRPKPADIIATATLMRMGRRLAFCKVDLLSGDDLVAHATVTYALPHAEGAIT